MFFNLMNCPTEWINFPEVQGRYLVGLPAGGSRGAIVGTALSDQDNRAVGQHTHSINDPGHFHQHPNRTYTIPGTSINGTMYFCHTPANCSPSPTGITVADSGSVTGTNAPYIQLLACQKISTAPGKILNNLMVTKNDNNPVLTWQAVGTPCAVTGYAVYRGSLPIAGYDHMPLGCSVPVTTYTDSAAPGSYYYLVVPVNDSNEGSYGVDSSGNERTQSISPCKPQDIAVCN